jgi:hypothetical protein
MFRQFLVGTAASACNITIHALVMVTLLQIARRSSSIAASQPSLRLIAVMIATVSILMASHASEVIVWSLSRQSQDRTPASATPRDPSLATNYRGSGLVLRRNLRPSKPPEGKLDGSEGNEGGQSFREVLEILGETPVSSIGASRPFPFALATVS